ncbi:MAG: hypothetical protein KBG15_08230 [Kofleriaceae bacterium]|nr:hypothetical protein [Kofleriaceae bacterium]
MTGSWLRRAVIASVLLHVVIGGLAQITIGSRSGAPRTALIDIEMAPPPPLAEALPQESAAAQEAEALAATSATPPAPNAGTEPGDQHEPGDRLVDAPLVDAPIDAPGDARRRQPDARAKPDARPKPDAGQFDAPADAPRDASPDAPFDAPLDAPLDAPPPDAMAVAVAATDAPATPAATSVGTGPVPGDGSAAGSSQVATGEGSGSALAMTGSGRAKPPLIDTEVPPSTGSGAGSGTENLPAVDGAPTTAGTAANLLTYFPKGHQVAALIRFDRLRNTRWQSAAEKLFAPMPDYQVLFGQQDAKISDRFDMLVISTPEPKDATATTLVGKTTLSRAALRAFLEQPEAPVTWSVVKGGMFGSRGGTRKAATDKRVILSPYLDWFILGQPIDLGSLTSPSKGQLDTAVAGPKTKGWLGRIRTIEAESGNPRGPALVVTIALPAQRLDIPDIGVGVASVPAPSRFTLAMEITRQGWLLRGNMTFATEAAAIEFADAVTSVQKRITGNRILQRILKNSHAQNAINGLSVKRSGERVSYATSISIADADGMLAYAAVMLSTYFDRAH